MTEEQVERWFRLQKIDKMHALINVKTNEIITYFTTNKMEDNIVFYILTNMAFTKSHVFDTIYVDLTCEAEEN